MEDKRYEIKFDKGVFSAQRTSVSTKKKEYTQAVAERNKAVEELDRYDDFDYLRIEPGKYVKGRGASYGIEFNEDIHVDGVLLPHQLAAAQAFLSGLRGFGMLADVVGSGKTYEAGIILSELAARGKVQSLLIITPDQAFADWKDVIENKFGLGKDSLQELGPEINSKIVESEKENVAGEEVLRPVRPAIVKMEDFAHWSTIAGKFLFDVIIVDEAHHLCSEEGEYAAAMRLLSVLMQTKKRAGKPYCLLLSATPHSGNLAKMFRLWYFVRCKGGSPDDFDESRGKSKDFLREQAYYTDHVCRGAKTVMEFIRRVKITETYNAPLNKNGKNFEDYLREKGVYERFKDMTYGEQALLADEYLRLEECKELEGYVISRIASAYHNGLLRSIMIRQPHRKGDARMRKRKDSVNVFFCSVPGKRPSKVSIYEFEEKEPVTVDLDNLDGEEAVTYKKKKFSLERYVENTRGDENYSHRYSEVMNKILNAAIGGEEGQKKVFSKRDSVAYYWNCIEKSETSPKDYGNRAHNRLVFAGNNESIFDKKIAETVRILKKHSEEKAIIFFDYDLDDDNRVDAKVIDALAKDPEIVKRMIISDPRDKNGTLEEFNEKDNAVLVCTDAAFTESVNLQTGSVIINFQVTPDPVAMDQRIGRVCRLGQKNNITIYSLADIAALEGYILAYYAYIKIMSSSDGDATIIAGSNSEEMVTVRCPACNDVKLYSYEDFVMKKKNGELFCDKTDACKNNGDKRGTPMVRIADGDFKCDNCGTVLKRSISGEGYRCMAKNNTERGRLCGTIETGDRRVFCSKLCAMAHCRKLKEMDCPVVKAYMKNPNIETCNVEKICNTCPKSRTGECPSKCRFNDITPESIKSCSTCDEATCQPKPHVIKFTEGENWEAKCPVCGDGTLRKISARTFAAYICRLWNFDGKNEKFCENLSSEARKVDEIKKVLDADSMGGNA